MVCLLWIAECGGPHPLTSWTPARPSPATEHEILNLISRSSVWFCGYVCVSLSCVGLQCSHFVGCGAISHCHEKEVLVSSWLLCGSLANREWQVCET